MDDIRVQLELDATKAIESSNDFTASIEALQKATTALNSATGLTASTIKKSLAPGIRATKESTDSLKNAFREFETVEKRYANATQQLQTEAVGLYRTLTSNYNSVQRAVKATDAAFNKAAKEAQNYSKALEDIENSATVTEKQLKKLEETQKTYQESLAAARSYEPSIAGAQRTYKTANLASTFAQQDPVTMEASLVALQRSYDLVQQKIAETTRRQAALGEGVVRLQEQLKTVDPKSKDYEKLNNAITLLRTRYLEASTALLAYDKKQNTVLTTINSLHKKQIELQQDIANSEGAYSRATASLERYDKAMQSLANDESALITRQTALTQRIKEQQEAQLRSSAAFIPAINIGELTGFGQMVGMFSSIARASRNAIYAINAFRIAFNLVFGMVGLRAAMSVVSSFDQTVADMNSIIRTAGDTTIETQQKLDALKQTMEELGATSRYTTTEAGQGMIYMAQSGMSAAEIMQAASNVLDLAVSSNTDLARASDIVIQTMRTFNIEAKDAWQVTDTLAMGAKSSVTSISQLADALKYVGPIAHTLGIRIDTVVAALGSLSDSGLQASMAGTGLRRIISEIINPTFKARKILDSMGLTIDKLDIQGLGLIKVLENIRNANLSAGQSFAIWGDRGTPALMTLMANFDKFKEKYDKISLDNLSVQGTAHAMRSERENTLSGQWLASTSAIQEFIIKFSEYIKLTSTGTSVLRSFAEGLRSFNSDIGNTAAWLAAAATSFVVMLSPIKNVGTALLNYRNTSAKAKETFASFLETQKNWAASSITVLSTSRSQLDATKKLSAAFIDARLNLMNFLSAHKYMLVMAGALRSILGIALNVVATLAVPAVIGMMVKWMTSTDRANDAMERLKNTTALYFKEATTSSAAAKQTMDDYAASISNLTENSLKIREASLSKDINAISRKMTGQLLQGNPFDFGGAYMSTGGAIDIGTILFGKSTQDILAEAKKDINSLTKLWDDYATGKFGNLDQRLKLSGFVPDEASRKAISDYEEMMKTIIVAYKELAAVQHQQEQLNVPHVVSQEDLDSLKGFTTEGRDALGSLNAFADTIRNIKGTEFAKEAEKIETKITKLRKEFNDPIADKMFESLNKNIRNFGDFFEFDSTNYTVKLKDEIQNLISIVEKQKEGTGVSFLRRLGIDPDRLNKVIADMNLLSKSMQELAQVKIENKIEGLSKKFDLTVQAEGLSKQGQKVRDEMLKIFTPEQLNQFIIDYDNAGSEIQLKQEAVSDASQQMANNVQAAFDIVTRSIQEANNLKLSNLIDQMQQVQSLTDLGMTKDKAKSLNKFVSQNGLSQQAAEKYAKTGTFDDVTLASGRVLKGTDIAKAYEESLSTSSGRGAQRVKKLTADIANEIEELRLKYDQYFTDITGGSKNEIELRKLALEKQKEAANLFSKAESLGISKSDSRIVKLREEIEAVYALREAELQRKASQEQAVSPLKTEVARQSQNGGDASVAKIALAQQELEQLNQDLNVLSVNTTGYYNKLSDIYNKASELANLEYDRATKSLEISQEYAKRFGTIQDERDATAALIELDRQRIMLQKELLEKRLNNSDLTEDERTRLLQQISDLQRQNEILSQKKEEAATGKRAFNLPYTTGEWMDNLQKMYDETATWKNAMTNAFDEVSDALVDFIVTGEFNFSNFANSMGKMLVELTTKMMMMKFLSWGFGFADGGVADVSANATGNLVHLTPKKYAGGGLLTRPTMFNTTSGTALAGEAGYEHIMPAARLSNGKWGVYAEGFGGGTNQQIVINNTVNVESTGGNSASGGTEEDDKLANRISEKLSESIRQSVQYELRAQMRPGGVLNSSGNQSW